MLSAARLFYLMRKKYILCLLATLLLTACSPRDFLSRRLAGDLIAASPAFKAPQQYILQTGVVANKDFVSPEYLVLQHHGWISGATTPCSPGLGPPPCWDVRLTPSGVDTVRTILPAEQAEQSTFTIPVARRELIAVTGVSRVGNNAEVEFTWKWISLNEIGAALYSGDVHYRSNAGFRDYDDGWRLLVSAPHPVQTLDDGLKNAEPTP
jgi:hypothetical protein